MPLEVKDLSVFLASGEVVTEHISFQIEKGKMLSIVGSSGAGKTTIYIIIPLTFPILQAFPPVH